MWRCEGRGLRAFNRKESLLKRTRAGRAAIQGTSLTVCDADRSRLLYIDAASPELPRVPASLVRSRARVLAVASAGTVSPSSCKRFAGRSVASCGRGGFFFRRGGPRRRGG